MRHSDRMNKSFVVWAVLLALGAAGTGLAGAAQPASADPLRIIPADALFCVRVNRLTTTLSQMDQFLTGVSPQGVSMPVRSQLGQLLGQPEPAGINMAGDVAVFWPLPGGEKPQPGRVGVLMPLRDFAQFLTNPNVAQPDAQGIVAIGPEDRRTLAGVRVDNYLLVTRTADRQALVEAKNWTAGASLAQRLSPDELKRATDAPAWAYANIQIANKMFGPKLQEQLKKAQATFQKMQAAGQSFPGQTQAMLEIYASMLDSLMQQTQFVSVSLDPSATVIRLASVVSAVPNTEMAKILSLDGPQPQPPNLFGYLDNGAVTNGVYTLSPALLKALMLKYADLLTAMVGATAPQEDLAKIRQLMTDSADALGGSLAWSLSTNLKSKPPFEAKYVATLRDKQKFYQVVEQSSKIMNEGPIADFYKKLGLQIRFDIKRNVETYKDVPIDAIRFVMQPVDANKPDPQMQMMRMMFGEGFNLRLAIVDNLLLYTLAADPQPKIHALIDQAKAGGPTQIAGEVQAALDLLPDARTAEFFVTYNFLRLMQLGMALVPAPVAPMDVPSRSGGIAFAGDIGSGRLLTSVAIAKQHVLEIMGFFMRMQQQKMKEQEKQPIPPQPAAQPSQRSQS